MDEDRIFISRCIELAANAFGDASPNPLVGCVIVHEGRIIGEGYHMHYGGPHAEVNAINSVKDKSLLKDSTLYVSLEPCVHFGKTPPCTDLILEHNIPNVVVSIIDCYSEVAGKGIRKLKKAGVNVRLGMLSKESRELNKRFYTFYEKKRPYIILKWAETADGFMDIKRDADTPKGAAWITNEYSDILVHKWRSEEDSIIVGTNTAITDNPQLNVRHYTGRDPVRLVIDRNLRVPMNYHLFNKKQQTIVFTELERQNDVNIDYVKIDFSDKVCQQILSELYCRKIQSIIIEGGKALFDSLIKEGLWDEARVFVCSKTFSEGLKAPELNGKVIAEEDINGDKLVYLIRH